MARFKTATKKLKLARASDLSRAVPSWVMVKTRGRVRTSFRRRNWRRSSLDI
ncbi:MAG: 50S ribosomal protein L39e [Candidatus Bathyarchaeia archaeon]